MSWEVSLPVSDGKVLSFFCDERGEAKMSLKGGGDPPITMEVYDLAAMQLFGERVSTLVSQDAQRLQRHNTTLHHIRQIARELVKLLDEGDLDSVRATLETYALPGGPHS